MLLSIKQNERPVTLRSLDSHTMEGFGRGAEESYSVKSQSLLSNYHTDSNLNKERMFARADQKQHATETQDPLPTNLRPMTTRSDTSLTTV